MFNAIQTHTKQKKERGQGIPKSKFTSHVTGVRLIDSYKVRHLKVVLKEIYGGTKVIYQK